MRARRTREATLRLIRRRDALFLGYLDSPSEVHSHHALQCSIALEGELRVAVGASRSESLPSVLIRPDEPHCVSAPGRVAHFYVSPESSGGAGLRALLSGRAFVQVEGWLPPRVRAALRQAWRDETLLEPCLDLLNRSVVDPSLPPSVETDARVTAVLRILHREDPSLSLGELSCRVGLSPERLRHLFKRDTGSTLRRYKQWLRLVHSIEALRDGSNVTEAATRAGFADAAHLSRVFRESFCSPPRAMVESSRFVQAARVESK